MSPGLCARQLVVYHRRAGGQIAVLCTAGAGAQIRPHPERAGLCKAQSQPSKLTVKTACQRGASKSASVQPCVPRRDRAIAGQGDREPARRDRPPVDGAEPPFDIDVIARQTGFADRYRMRRAFLRAFGQPPQVIRRNARAELAA